MATAAHYYRQVDFRKANGRYAQSLRQLGLDLAITAAQLFVMGERYAVTLPSLVAGQVTLTEDGKVWVRR